VTANAKIAVVVGTRPEAIKLAPLVRALRAEPGLEPVLVSTGQHRQMLDQALGVFGLSPDVELGVMSAGQTLEDVTSRALEGMRGFLRAHRPAWVVVQGDTTTAFAAALAAFYARVPVAHVEAGLRSGNRHSPFPEEVNRRLVDQLSEELYAPTSTSRALLLAEGFDPARVHVTGNTVVDALLATRDLLRTRNVALLGVPPELAAAGRLVLVTAHRRESFGPGLEAICRALVRIARAAPDVRIVYPVHLNPNVDGPVRRILGEEPRITLLPPVDYLGFVALLDRAHLVLTDSGGVQEEAPTFAKPILVMREVTERPEGIAAGVAKLVGTDEQRIAEETIRLLEDPAAYRAMATGSNPYGDGHASERIARRLAELAAPRAQGPELAASGEARA
jgi:UDP-N-acetylglucosamine 2-epimerase (non-hydrolysing)